MELLSRTDLQDIGRQYLISRTKKIDPEQVDLVGSNANIFVGSVAYMAHAISRQLADRVGALMLDGCETDEDLDRYAWDRYQLLRKGAAGARVPLKFFRPTATAGAGNIPIGTRVVSLSGVSYVTVQDAGFGLNDLTQTANARAVQAGTSSQVGKNQLRRFDNQASLFDQTLTVNNEIAAAGGADRESFDVYKERIRDFWNSARRGTLGAIEFGAKLVKGVESATAFEALTSTNQPARAVVLHVADAAGISNAQLAQEVSDALVEFRGGGIFVQVLSSVPQIVDIELALTFSVGKGTQQLKDTIRTSIVSFINSLGVNQPLYRQELGAVLARYRSSGLIPTEQTIVQPAGDVVPDQGLTLRTRLENVTTT